MNTQEIAYWMGISFGLGLSFTLFNFSSKIFNVDTLFIFRHGSQLVMKASIVKNPEDEHVCWRHDPYVSGVHRIRESLDYASHILGCSTSNSNSLGADRLLGRIET